ncbi:hypothetical protein UWK_00855 [Desulfocapsa sulfexigens DSM 10523]|uniref:Uncharacterized protein n=1 Tax=Desulfocapsa sulfexigens (strain DSM 10523 / SB164P1) TaxID=1167006 RepID=M1NCD8_DESSD|nr:hypothetical protein [Desulfocapsa sulfexigens]AGF77429.1 hypothetical protein UWK_00855 [Desulfocapsa sulfexigens DSM 10523]
MNRWQEKLENHPIHETLNWVRDNVSENFNDLDEDEIIEKRRLLKIVSMYEEALRKIDPEIVPYNQLDSLNTQLRHQNISSQLTSYKSNGNVAHLTSANDLIANQLTQLSLLMGMTTSYSIEPPIKELEQLIDTISSTLISKKDALSKILENLSDSSKTNETQLQQLSDKIDTKKQEIDGHISEWQQQFSAAQENRSQSFTDWRDKFSEEKLAEIDTVISKYNEKLSENESEFEQKISSILSDSDEKHKSILELYEITARDSVGAGYLKNANQEKTEANKWRFVSVGFIILTVFWLLFSYHTNFKEKNITEKLTTKIEEAVTRPPSKDIAKSKIVTTDQSKKSESISSSKAQTSGALLWFKLFSTFSISGVLLWGSAYSAQQSTVHRNNEKRNRWFALQIKAFDPFISTLDEDEQKNLKKQLCEKIFGQAYDYKETDPKVIDEHALKTFADTFGNLLSKIPR